MTSSRVRPFVAGVLVGNSAPHLATAITGRRHLTPLAGRGSGPAVNGLWGLINLVGGLLLLSPDTRRTPGAWNDDLIAFETGVAAFGAWMAVAERTWGTNTRAPKGRQTSARRGSPGPAAAHGRRR